VDPSFATAAVLLISFVALVLAYRVIIFALRRKGDVKAGVSAGRSSFYIEVKDRRSK